MTSITVLDELDKRILQQLQQDSSLSNQDLAAKVHASPPTCLRRVKRLMDTGVIAKQVAILAPEKVGAGLTAIVEITLDVQTSEKMQEFEQLAAAEKTVQQCYRVSPGPDFVLIIQVADMTAYHQLAHRLFATQSNIRNVRSFFSMFRSKFETYLAL
ncbi:Lrp/AsnC family transcriptional regulator [Iodobacter fluviatilis]|jgi:Lrp/AsnC family leucine-responsive transcriptional regulator|uniref:AsnC family transcriptional regulator n=1 Tax=Iodobacter fluviatilis TaxID=537 RepID=A0A7G3G4V8_9NEIS|nr:Lrp/AsnC family transcriptional regulator [Iodobacter fluviatilis]MCX7206883.1 Lrp/AsnC family transcriptional regulator [Pseudomonadota bacterium]QBC42480.1 AsnC family transcriptional regulator [Iodobacter fluviatilis]